MRKFAKRVIFTIYASLIYTYIYIYSSYIYPYSSSSEHPIWDFAQEHAIVLHFETKNKDLLSNYVFSKTVSAVNLND